jgi:hypothetical protein
LRGFPYRANLDPEKATEQELSGQEKEDRVAFMLAL